MNDRVWHLRARMEDALNPIFDLFDDGQYCLLGAKERAEKSELQYDADKLDMALTLLCERMPQYWLNPMEETVPALSQREVDDPIGKRRFLISVNVYNGYDLRIHTETDGNWLHHKGLKLASVIATLCAIFYSEVDADPTDPHGILNFKPSGVFGS